MMRSASCVSRRAFSIVSLGCFRNTYDSEVIARKFSKEGYIFKKDISSGCDLLIINTCGFIDSAKAESIEAIKEIIALKKKKRVKKIVVFGCLVKRYANELKKFFPEVDEWYGPQEFSKAFSKREKITPYFYDFLKICEGCLNRCSFCAIPLIKGPLISRAADEVVKEAKYLDKRGVKELNIVGQDITGWGKDLKSNKDLTFLLKKILKQTKNIEWIRLIYTHPRNFSDSLIELIAKEKRICKYIDLPIQHINDRILKVMNRGITKDRTIKLIRKIRKKIPDCIIRTSVIAGFPTETEKEFKELLGFLKDIKFERLGAFIYSREEGTPAYDLAQVHPATKKRRFKEIMNLQSEIAQEISGRFVNRQIKVLVEEKESNVFIGRTQYDAPEVDGSVFLKKKGLKIGSFYNAKIIDAYGYDLVGI